MEEPPPNAIVESRQELMVSPKRNENPRLRTAQFLKPSITSTDGISSPCLPPLPITFDPKKWPLSVNFQGWRHPIWEWNTWVVKMASLHEPTWRKAGIYEAIFNSTYRINKMIDLVLGVAERWSPETNSFIFRWGEATITLEDVMVISGYSALGCPVFSPVGTKELKEIEEKLIQSRAEVVRSSAKKARQYSWLKKFKDSGSEIEHEAFLALWLSRFVLVTFYDVICENTFSIAVQLARGIRVALAPAVLASVYRDLSLLKEKIVALSSSELYESRENGVLAVTLRSPFHLVQVWVWERFLGLQPKPNFIKSREPRFAQWNNLYPKLENNDVRLLIDSAKESFLWRPYAKALANWSMPKFYVEKEMWVSINPTSDEELLSFVRFLRPSELVGLDCIEQYLPQRVAMQFGIDQDVPSCVPRCNENPEHAWSYYDHFNVDFLCYLPSWFYEAEVTERYLRWWENWLMVSQDMEKSNPQQEQPFAKDGEISISSLKIRSENLKTSLNGRRARKEIKSLSMSTCLPKRNSKEMAGTTRQESRSNGDTNPLSSLVNIHIISEYNTKGDIFVVSDQLTTFKSSPSVKRKSGEEDESVCPKSPTKTAKTLLLSSVAEKHIAEINSSSVCSEFSLRNLACNQLEVRGSPKGSLVNMAELLKSCVNQPVEILQNTRGANLGEISIVGKEESRKVGEGEFTLNDQKDLVDNGLLIVNSIRSHTDKQNSSILVEDENNIKVDSQEGGDHLSNDLRNANRNADATFDGNHDPAISRSTATPLVSSLASSCYAIPTPLQSALNGGSPKTYIAQFDGPSYTDFHGFHVLHCHTSCLEWILGEEGTFWGNVDTLGEYTISHLLNVIGDVYAIGAKCHQTSLEEKDLIFIVRYIEICMGLGFKLECLRPLLENARSKLNSFRERRLQYDMEREMTTLDDPLQEAKTIGAS